MIGEIPDPETSAFKFFPANEIDPSSPSWLKGYADGYAEILDGMPADYTPLEQATYYDGYLTGDAERRLSVSPD